MNEPVASTAVHRLPREATKLSTVVAGRLRSLAPRPWHLLTLALAGAVAAAGVGYQVSINPHAAPHSVAVELRVAIILALLAAGIYGMTEKRQSRMGALLVGAAVYSSLWLLNGSGNRAPFSVGVLLSCLAPTIFSFIVLAYPAGRLRSRPQRVLLAGAGGLLVLFWTPLVLTGAQPTRAPLVQCAPDCPSQIFFVGSIGSDLTTVLKAGLWLSWAAIVCGTPLLLWRAAREASALLRRTLIPFEIVTCANAAFWVAWVATDAAGSKSSTIFGAAYVAMAFLIPLAILVRLGLDRSSIGRALATFVNRLAAMPRSDPEALMADALNDPSLTIAYLRPSLGTYVDASGAPVAVPDAGSDRAVAWIEPGKGPVAAVIYDANLTDRAPFVHAAGAAAEIRLEAAQLEAELKASSRELAASRRRIMEAADAERQRIERDLHDGVQQHVVGLRLRLELATEAIKADPARCERHLAGIGRQLDELIGELRSLAKGIYPSLLSERGLKKALVSVSLTVPVPVSVSASNVGRYPRDIEVAVYFCCVEAIQNVVKHAGPIRKATVRLWERGGWLRFEVRDSGTGFDPHGVSHANGLINMQDRIAAVGGMLWVTSQVGRGTSVRAKVPTTTTRTKA
jgi:signal transduction histidine kinase